MPPRTTSAGRHGGARRSLRSELTGALSQSGIVKMAAGGGLVAAVAASVAVPSMQDTGITTQESANVAFAPARDASAQAASRTTERVALDADAARSALIADVASGAPIEANTQVEAKAPTGEVAASAPVTPVVAEEAAVSGITAEAKPVEAPPVDTQSAGGSSQSASVAGGFDTTSYAGAGAALGLGYNAQRVYSAVRGSFGPLVMGGYRAGDTGDHGAGRAVDVMVDSGTGDAVAAFIQAHAGELNVNYIIWKQRIWFPGGGWQWMEDRGSITQNHYDHVHISVY